MRMYCVGCKEFSEVNIPIDLGLGAIKGVCERCREIVINIIKEKPEYIKKEVDRL